MDASTRQGVENYSETNLNWFSERWNKMIVKVPSNPDHSMILNRTVIRTSLS